MNDMQRLPDQTSLSVGQWLSPAFTGWNVDSSCASEMPPPCSTTVTASGCGRDGGGRSFHGCGGVKLCTLSWRARNWLGVRGGRRREAGVESGVMAAAWQRLRHHRKA